MDNKSNALNIITGALSILTAEEHITQEDRREIYASILDAIKKKKDNDAFMKDLTDDSKTYHPDTGTVKTRTNFIGIKTTEG